MSLPLLFHAMMETALISAPTVWESRRGTLTQAACDLRLRSWSERLLKRTETKLRVSGLEHLKTSAGPFVVVSNHQSHYDIPALYQALPLSLRMAAKQELFQIPLWGPALRASGFVEIDRSSPKAAFRALRAAGDHMKQEGLSLFVAPEGTRSETGELGPFKSGAFDLARIVRLPILPVAIDGTIQIHQKGSRHINKGVAVEIRVLSPIEARDFGPPRTLATTVRDRIENALAPQECASSVNLRIPSLGLSDG